MLHKEYRTCNSSDYCNIKNMKTDSRVIYLQNRNIDKAGLKLYRSISCRDREISRWLDIELTCNSLADKTSFSRIIKVSSFIKLESNSIFFYFSSTICSLQNPSNSIWRAIETTNNDYKTSTESSHVFIGCESRCCKYRRNIG